MIYLKKSEEVPASLIEEKAKPNGTYRCQDVYNALLKDFHSKCYICGTNKLNAGIHIEHRIPHKDNLDLKFDWKNLYLSCSHCNNLKNDKYENILDCANENDNVDNSIKHTFVVNASNSSLIITALVNDEKTENTVNLIQAVFDGTTIVKKIEANFLRKDVTKDLNEMLNVYEKYVIAENEEYKNYQLNELKKILSRESSYTAIKRWYLKDTLNRPELTYLFD